MAELIRPHSLRRKEQAAARSAVLMLVVFLLGLGGGAYLYHRATKSPVETQSQDQPIIALSGSTKAILKRLESPVEIRFYALLDPTSVPDSMQAFAARVDQLLTAYQQEAAGKINLSRFNSRSDANAQAAAADGINAFNRDKGDVCYIGLAVAQLGRKELLPQLAPDWEAAMESDVTRAIVRVTSAQPSATSPLTGAQPDLATIEDVKRMVPNFASVSLEEGTRVLREGALKDFASAADEMELRQKEAQQRITDAQGKSEAEQQSARKNLQQVQLEQAEKLKQVAARVQSQITALHQLKKE